MGVVGDDATLMHPDFIAFSIQMQRRINTTYQKKNIYTVNKKDARREIPTRMNILWRPSRVVLGKHPRYMPSVSEFASPYAFP